MSACKDCYWAKRSDIGNPLKRHCIAKRKDLEETEAMKSLMAGKLVNTSDPACEMFKPKGKGVDKRDMDA
ncbi:conserved hypothetical protein [uncultured Desulfobacterium sp.]|uniref:Uncharacterized protein n=1 Tax=uncultured Desulfobacterium sp. TaxID=201089 RepID=A0A445MZ33_9BACT|nr:conserved hypothetical protein [uncultured Desulfobacterium sp.]SPD74683.1 conserved hypothetical protein [uncultured Desulfobacterium sp.]